ncbi:MAG: hypothetical protein H0X65_08305 [Gemmatimonadetes bacterium]|nr:hypothetical protein [Gemmatimonadota bacterium]
MRSTSRSLVILPLLLLTALPGCRRGSDAAVEPVTPAMEAPTDPWAALPPDSLYGATAVENLRLVPAELELRGVPRGWDGMRIAAISDLQLGLWDDNGRVAEAAIRLAVDANPDIIVLLGDYLAVGQNVGLLDRVLAPLQGRAAVAVLGDRDLRSDTLASRIQMTLRGHGVTVLRNGVAAFARGGDTAFIAGVDPGFGGLGALEQAEAFATLPPGAATPVLLSHLPEALVGAAAERYPLILAGHTFCGQVEIPGTPRLATLQTETLALAHLARTERLFRSNGNTLLMTCGTGYSFIPIRFGAAPEVVLVTLLRLPDPPAEGTETELPPQPAIP